MTINILLQLQKKEEKERELVRQKRLRIGLDKFEYEAIPEEAWDHLYSWYGGGPVICRPIIGSGVTRVPILELYPLSLKLQRYIC